MSKQYHIVDVPFNKIKKQVHSNTHIYLNTQQPERKDIYSHHRNNTDKNEIGNRARTSPKHCQSSPFVEDQQPLQRSAIQELQSLDYVPAITEHALVSKKTFHQFNIRKSISLDKEKIQLSFSSQYVDYQSENIQLKKRVEDLEKQIQCYAEIEQKVILEIAAYKKNIQDLSNKLASTQEQLRKAQSQINEQKFNIQSKQHSIAQLRSQLNQINKQIEERNNNSQKLKKNAQNQKQQLSKSHIKKIQSLEQQHQIQINILQNQFNLAKTVGQQQINNLILLLQKKQQQNLLLKNTIRLKNSTHISSNSPSQSKQQKYMSRFNQFVNIIDRKIYSSQNKQSSIFCNTVVTHSAIEKNRSHLNNGYFGKLDEKKSQYLQPLNIKMHTIF